MPVAAENAGVAYIFVDVVPAPRRWTVGRVRWAPNERSGVAYIFADVVAGVPRGAGGGLGENEFGEDG